MIRTALTETKNVYDSMPSTVSSLGQLEGHLDQVREANIEHHCELARTAAAAGAQLICFGELFAGPYFAIDRNPMWRGLAENAMTGPTVSRMTKVARELGLVIVAPIYELADDATGGGVDREPCRYNTAVVIEADGSVLGKYRKTHIPEGENEQNSFCESFYYERSTGDLGCGPSNVSTNPCFPVFQTSVCKLGVAICYDRHFDGVMRTLAKQGAELVVSPAVTFGEKSRRMWEREFEVDACRENIFIGGSNRRGSEAPWNQEYFGGSYFVGPNGRVDPITVHENLVVADLDLEGLRAPDPSGWQLARDRRPEICD